MLKFSDYVVVFDLDDTLYKEQDYVTSGTQVVLNKLLALRLITSVQLGEYCKTKLGHTNIIDNMCAAFKLNPKIKDELLWVYRLHEPNIDLDAGTKACLVELQKNVHSLAIITDGRSITQRLKIEALGLNSITAFVSAEYEQGKPHLSMFQAVQEQWANKQYVYVADNVAKDFFAPNSLGWKTIGLKNDGRNIRSDNKVSLKNYEPQIWIETMSELQFKLI